MEHSHGEGWPFRAFVYYHSSIGPLAPTLLPQAGGGQIYALEPMNQRSRMRLAEFELVPIFARAFSRAIDVEVFVIFGNPTSKTLGTALVRNHPPSMVPHPLNPYNGWLVPKGKWYLTSTPHTLLLS